MGKYILNLIFDTEEDKEKYRKELENYKGELLTMEQKNEEKLTDKTDEPVEDMDAVPSEEPETESNADPVEETEEAEA